MPFFLRSAARINQSYASGMRDAAWVAFSAVLFELLTPRETPRAYLLAHRGSAVPFNALYNHPTLQQITSSFLPYFMQIQHFAASLWKVFLIAWRRVVFLLRRDFIKYFVKYLYKYCLGIIFLFCWYISNNNLCKYFIRYFTYFCSINILLSVF